MNSFKEMMSEDFFLVVKRIKLWAKKESRKTNKCVKTS